MNNNSSLSSGFIGTDIPKDEELYSEVQPFFSSESGYTQLYVCRINGKLHIIKGLKDLYKDKALYQQLLRKEFEIGYSLDHPNICKIIGWRNMQEIGPCILMEYIDGITLREYLKIKTIKKEDLMRIIGMICDALSYIHSKQIIHRDLKPENILITHNGNNVRLIDFGLSDSDDYDILKIPAGTKTYIAPEILNGEKQIDARADIYSLGIILKEIASCIGSSKINKVANHCTKRRREERPANIDEVVCELNKPHLPFWGWALLIILLIAVINIVAWSIIGHEKRTDEAITTMPTEHTSDSIDKYQIFSETDSSDSTDNAKTDDIVVSISHLPSAMADLKHSADEASEHPKDASFRKVILNYVECLRAAYEDKNIEFIDQVFSEKALIITGKVLKMENTITGYMENERVEYNIRSKKEYIANLSKVFKGNKAIKLLFNDPSITRHPTKDGFYGVTLKQGYRSDGYSDEGYLFLLWDFRNPKKPQIYVRTWQALMQKDNVQLPDDMIFKLSDFNLE